MVSNKKKDRGKHTDVGDYELRRKAKRGEGRGTEFGRKQNESEESKKQTVSNKGNNK